MCLAIPGQLEDVREEHGLRVGRVRFSGIARDAVLEAVPEAVPGDWLLVHVGVALSRLDEAEAKRTLALLEELGAMEELGAEEPPA
jgi:hydrogenase expression/formation protein HypC